MDLDLAFVSEKPVALTFASNDEDKSFYKAWKISNRLSLMFMWTIVVNSISPQLQYWKCQGFYKIYRKYDEKSHCFDQFAKFLESRVICAQYTISKHHNKMML